MDELLEKYEKKETDKAMCHLCPRVFERVGTKHALQCHISHVHKVRKCPMCDKIFKRSTKLNDHIKGVHEKVCNFCDLCEASYTLKSSLQQHKSYVHVKGRPIIQQMVYPCDQCKVKFRLRHRDCKSHKAKCDKCGFITSHKGYLKKHQNGPMCHPEKVRQKNFICEECSKAFTTEKAKEKHKIQHIFGKPYKCECCGIGFTNSWVMTKHIKKNVCKSKTNVQLDIQ